MNLGKMAGFALAAMLLACGGAARADFELFGAQQLTVNTSHSVGILWEQSEITVVAGGSVNNIWAMGSSTVNISDGSVGGDLAIFGTSTANIFDGVVHEMAAEESSVVNLYDGSVSEIFSTYDSSTANVYHGSAGQHFYVNGNSTAHIYDGSLVNLASYSTGTVYMSGGSVSGYLSAWNTSSMNISGGSFSGLLYAGHTSTVTFVGQDFLLGAGLALDGDKVLGTGILSGKWLNGTPWAVNITQHDAGATILAVPEPATLSLLALCGLAVLRRRRRSR